MKTNRGQLGGNLQGIIFTIMIIGILIGSGFFIFGELLGQFDEEPFITTNETGGWVNSSGYTLVTTAPSAHDFSITAMRNGSDGATISSTLYTVNAATGVVTNSTAVLFQNADSADIDYTYVGGGDAYDAMNASVQAFDTVPDLLPLVVLIAMIVIILGLVFTIPGARQGA